MRARAVQLWAQLRELPEAEVTRHIGADRYSAIRAGDEHPFFVGLDVAYEGESHGEVAGHGNRVKRWAQTVISKLGRLLNGPETPGLYEGHAQPGQPRQRLGDLVSGFVEPAADGRLHAYGVGYVQELQARERIQRGELDACSVEAECLFGIDESGHWDVEDVRSVQGVALANSRFERPGFAGAGIVAVIQELESQESTSMDRDAIRQAIQQQGLGAFFDAGELPALVKTLTPSALFDKGRLQSDPAVQAIRDEGLSQQAVEVNNLRTENASLKEQAQTLRLDANRGRVGTLLDEALKAVDLKLSEAERQLVRRDLSQRTYDADDEAKLKEQVGAAVKQEARRLDDVRQLYGKKPTPQGADTSPASDGGGDGDGEEGKTGDAFLDANPVGK